MLIKDLFKEENKNLVTAYGVELPKMDDTDFYENIDEYSQPPENLEFVGFILDLDEEDEVSEPLLDLILSYKLTNLSIALEVPSHLVTVAESEPGKISLKSLLVLSSNLDCSLSFLPPNHPAVDPSYTNEQYTELMATLTKSLLEKPNHSQLVMPVSNYQEYLMLEQLLGPDNQKVKEFKPTDDYILQHFTPYSSVEEQNQFKAAIKDVIVQHYGGEDAFKQICTLIFQGINKKSKEFLRLHVLNYIEERKAQEQSSENHSDNKE